MSVHLTYDATTDVAYLRLRVTGPTDVIGPALILEKDRAFPYLVVADFTLRDGCLVGFEFLDASKCLPAELLANAERIDGEHVLHRLDERLGRLLAHGMPKSEKKQTH